MPQPPKVNTILCQKKVLISLIYSHQKASTHPLFRHPAEVTDTFPQFNSFLPNCLNNWQEEVNSLHAFYFFSKFSKFLLLFSPEELKVKNILAWRGNFMYSLEQKSWEEGENSLFLLDAFFFHEQPSALAN